MVCCGDVMVSMVMCTVGVQQLEDQLDIDNIVVARNEAEISEVDVLPLQLKLLTPSH